VVAACKSMKAGGWWSDTVMESNRDIRRSVLREAFFGR